MSVLLEIGQGESPIHYYEHVRGLSVNDSVAAGAAFVLESVEQAKHFMMGFGQSLRGDAYSDEKPIEERVLRDNVLAFIARTGLDDSDWSERWQQAYKEIESANPAE